MRLITTLSAALLLILAACGPPAATTEAGAQTNAADPAGAVTDAEKAAILSALELRANAQGQVTNECGELVTPQFLPADLGPGVGRAVAFAIGGGPNMASCYGDGPLVQLLRNSGGAWTQIYMNRGGPMIILATQHNNANDLADGGPGFSFPVWEWNGSTYADANRQVADSALGDARYLP